MTWWMHKKWQEPLRLNAGWMKSGSGNRRMATKSQATVGWTFLSVELPANIAAAKSIATRKSYSYGRTAGAMYLAKENGVFQDDLVILERHALSVGVRQLVLVDSSSVLTSVESNDTLDRFLANTSKNGRKRKAPGAITSDSCRIQKLSETCVSLCNNTRFRVMIC